MNSQEFISASIVLYKNDTLELTKTINCFLKTPLDKKLFLIDNSPTDLLRQVAKHPNIEYHFVGNNIGFGAGHNTIINNIRELSNYHLILNPDVTFELSVIPELIKKMNNNKDVSIVAPKVLFPNGNHQYSCRKYPGILELLGRRINLLGKILTKTILRADYRDHDLNVPFYVEYLTGCFLLFKTEDFVEIKGFDERYFLYMEDIDICRKVDMLNKKKLYYPEEKIYHALERGSAKKIKLFSHHIFSVFQYFYKWGVKN